MARDWRFSLAGLEALAADSFAKTVPYATKNYRLTGVFLHEGKRSEIGRDLNYPPRAMTSSPMMMSPRPNNRVGCTGSPSKNMPDPATMTKLIATNG